MKNKKSLAIIGKNQKQSVNQSIIDLLESQVKKTSNQTAITFGHQSMTYDEFNQRVNQFAHYLLKQKIAPHSVIALGLERSLELVIAIHGIIKAGMIYMPIDMNYPIARISYLLENAGAALVFTYHHLREKIDHLAIAPTYKVIFLEQVWPQIILENRDNLSTPLLPDDPAYLIYTSGSTGEPKGAINSHRGIFNRLSWMQDEFQLTSQEVVLQKTPFTFDVSMWEFFWPLLFGAQLVVAEPEVHQHPQQLAQIIDKYQISVIHFVPSMLKTFIEQTNLKKLLSLKVVICSGEALSSPLQNDFLKKSKARLYNLYGPTEAAIDVTYWPCDIKQYHDIVPIGKPISNTQLYILDENQNPVMSGETGELYIGGDNVGLGYINNPKLTAEKFIQNPLGKGRLYRTGDFVRQLPDGNVVFIGRVDDQVKIRGYRIELGEIEYWLHRYSEVSDAAVAVQKDKQKNKYLAAFLVLKHSGTLNITELKTFLSGNLPDYMIPSSFHLLDKLPVNANGKLDRKSLAQMTKGKPLTEGNVINSALSFTPPKTEDEKLLAIIWSDVLNRLPHQISIHDHFFELGGHSLSALHILIRMRLCLMAKLTLSDIFENPTIHSLLKKINQIRSQRKQQKIISIQKNRSRRKIPLSKSQELIWRHQQLMPHEPIYHETMNIHIPMAISVSRLEKSVNEIIKEHAIFRVRIDSSNDDIFQKITPYAPFKLPFTDLRSLPKKKRLKHALQLATQELKKAFQLAHENLFRFHLMQLDNHDFYLFTVFHHLLIDGVTLFQLLPKALETNYDYRLNGSQVSMKAEPDDLSDYHYVDFIQWEKSYLKSQKQALTKQLQFWKTYLKDLPVLALPYQHSAQHSAKQNRGKRRCLFYSKKLTERLKSLCTENKITLFTLLLTAYIVLLYRYTQQTDIPIGTIVSNRQIPETEKMMGNFLNTLIVRVKIDETATFRTLLNTTWQNLKTIYAHQTLPFQALTPFLTQEQDHRFSPIQAAFVFEPEFYESPHHWKISQLEIHPGTCKFDLTFELDVRNSGIIGRVEYSTEMFDDWFISQMIGHYEVILENMVDHLDCPISQLPILTAKEHQKLHDWNNTQAEYPKDKTIHQLFEAQVEKTPNHIAVVFEDKKLTYRELNEKANQLAHYLRKKGVTAETLVAIYIERSLEMIIGILGILKAGGAYVPIDTQYPTARVKYILEDTNTPIILTQASLSTNLTDYQGKLVKLDTEWQYIETASKKNLEKIDESNNLAYVLYTSGTTGKPKGVLIEHKSITNMILSQINFFEITENNIIIAVSAITFDASVSEIFSALISGASVHIIKSLIALPSSLKILKTSIVTSPPSLLNSISTNSILNLRTLVLAGEPIDNFSLNRMKISCKLINAYGPTEICVCASLFIIPQNNKKNDKVPIGKPIANTQCYVLDQSDQLVPIGVSGELHIGGAGLARGYLNQPELTREKFIPNPFGEGRLYKTGDLVRWLPDGNLEFIGRIDNQVKIRGFRIECGEIEAALLTLPEIQQALVIPKEDTTGDKYLAAYLIADKKIDPSTIKTCLKSQLPEYMIPVTYTFLKIFPLTTNGKIDKKALPEPNRLSTPRQYFVKPTTAIEKELLAVWQKILAVKRISITDHFFDLGGHSLKAIQLLSRVNQQYSITLTIDDVIRYPSIQTFAERITQLQQIAHRVEKNKSARPKILQSPQDNAVLVPLKTNGHKTPLFLIHPIGGTVFCYLPLRNYFDQDRPLYGLQDPSITLGHPLFNSLEEMATHYLQVIQSIQPHGPYLLGGLSSGSTVSIEIAHQLAEQNEEARFIGLFDGWSVYPKSIQTRPSLDESLRRHHDAWRKEFDLASVADLEKLFELQWQRLQLINHYQFKPIQQALTLFKAKELLSFFEGITAPYNFWESYAEKPITVYHIPGNHESILQEPHISTWAHLLNDHLGIEQK